MWHAVWPSVSLCARIATRSARKALGCLVGEATPKPLAVVTQTLGLLGVLCLSGCLTSPGEYFRNGLKVGPSYATPAAPISEAWIDSSDSRVISTQQEQWAWWLAFSDPILNRLIDISSQQNLTLREAGFRILEARAQEAQARGRLLPQSQTAVGGYSREMLSEQIGFIGGGGGGSGFPREFSIWSMGTQLQWEIDFWGRFRRAIEAASDNVDAMIEGYDEVIVILVADVATAYVDVRTLEQRLRYAWQNVNTQAASLKLAEDKRDLGAASQLDVAQAVTNLAQTEARIPQFEADLRQAKNRLCTLMGLPPQDIDTLLGGNTIIPIPSASPNVVLGIPADLVRRRPDVRRQERLVARQSAMIGVVESDLYPAFYINGLIGSRATQFSDLFRADAMTGNIGPSFNWNILNYGRIRNQVAAAEAQFMQQLTAYQQTVLNANREAEDAVIRFLQSQRQVRILDKAVSASKESSVLVNDLYKGGQTDFGRVFVAELILVQQQDALAVSEGLVARSLVDINRALGGGWQIRLQNLPPVEGSSTASESQPTTLEALPAPESVEVRPNPTE